MHRFNRKPLSVWPLICSLLTPFTSFAEVGDGCIIAQTDGIACMHLDAGTVGQTFTPCREGLLDYLVLYTGSSNEVSFAAELRILHGEKEMHKQQVILQSSDRQPQVRVRLARQPYLYPGETYTLELKVPGGKQIAVAYTENDHYSFGNMTLNGLFTPYDLAFEAGIRGFEEETPTIHPENCHPEQFDISGEYSLAEVRRQSFQLCNQAQLLGMSLGYSSPVDFTGRVQLMHKNDPYLPLAVMPFTAEASFEGRLVVTASGGLLLEPGKYHFEVIVDGDARKHVGLLSASGNPYPNGTLFTLDGPSEHDLSFSIITDEPTATPHQAASFEVLTGYEQHTCAIAQPFHDTWHAFSSTLLSIDLPLCDDGRLQTLYLPAQTTGITSAIVYHVKDQNSRILYSANIQEDQFNHGTLMLDLGEQHVVYYQNYTIVFDIPASATLELGLSSHPDHAGFVAKTDGQSLRFHPSLALGMEPYAFEEVATSLSPPVQFHSFPNPFNTDLTVELNDVKDREVTVRLFSVLGQELAVAHTDGSRAEESVRFHLDAHLERGYYTLRIESGDHVTIDTVVKQ